MTLLVVAGKTSKRRGVVGIGLETTRSMLALLGRTSFVRLGRMKTAAAAAAAAANETRVRVRVG